MGTEKARATAQGSHVLGSSKEKAYSAISLETKTAADVTTSTSSGTRIRETLCNYFDSQ